MPRDYNFWVYIVTNRNHSVLLYSGVTNRLSRRTWEHRKGGKLGFASKYQFMNLIYYEHYRDIRDAIARESQLKKWSRAKKIGLINRLNPEWKDLGMDVLQADRSRDFLDCASLRSK
jgi:putative endonuclease